jgi:glycosyltransferase involved in cell wall biosynthesis
MATSVVIPSYNSAPWVGDAIRSVLEQTAPAAEVIVVNDGSTDETVSVLAEFGDSIVVVNQENRGLAGARNAGARVATSEWLGFLDADDLYVPECLAAVERVATWCPKAEAIFVDHCDFDDAGVVLASNMATYVKDLDDHSQAIRGTMHELSAAGKRVVLERNGAFSPSCLFIRKRVFDALGGFHEPFRRYGAEDLDFYFRLVPEAMIAVDRRPLVRKRAHDACMSRKFDIMRAGNELALNRAEELYRRNFASLLPVVRKKRHGLTMSWGRTLTKLGRHADARRAYWAAVAAYPFDFQAWMGTLCSAMRSDKAPTPASAQSAGV